MTCPLISKIPSPPYSTLLHPCLAMVALGDHKNAILQGVESATTGIEVEKLEKLNPLFFFLILTLVPAVTSLKVQKALKHPSHDILRSLFYTSGLF